MKELIGKTIIEIKVDKENQHFLIFRIRTPAMGSTDMFYRTWGDCCSETWFADIEGVSFMIDGHVREVEEIESKEIKDIRSRDEMDTVYGYKIKTHKGDGTIIYRNSSNGFYGGDCYLSKPIEGNTIKIEEDWSA